MGLVKLGLFRILAGLRLGSFCIIGENPEVRIQNTGEGGWRLARVLPDGGCVGMVCNSPCFWCCFVLNYGTHYTIEQVKSQVFIGMNEGFSREKAWSSMAATKMIYPQMSQILADYLPRKGSKGTKEI